jgi:predicted nucleotidyltransferase
VSLAAWSGLPAFGIALACADHPGWEVDEARLAAICNRYGIAELKIFGSQARGTAQPGSDIDILYTLQPGHRLGWEIEQLADELAELFGGRVDLVSVRALHPLLRPSVLAEARPVYAA